MKERREHRDRGDTFNIYGSNPMVQGHHGQMNIHPAPAPLAAPTPSLPDDKLREQMSKLNQQKTELEEKLKKLDALKARCEEMCKERTERKRILFYVFEAILLLGLWASIYKFGWDVMEKWTYVATGAVWFIQVLIAYLKYGYASFGDAFTAMQAKVLNQVYAEQQYLPEEHTRLLAEREQINTKLLPP